MKPTRCATPLAACLVAALAGCDGAPSTIEQAMRENMTVLAERNPASALAWNDWLARHHATMLLEPDPPDIEVVDLSGPFDATAYAAPILPAKRHPDARHRHPIMSAPPDHVAASDLPTRREYVDAPHRRPTPLGWVENGLDAYLAEVNGSVALRFPDGELACLDWVRTNERPYTSLGRRLIEEGHAPPDGMTLEVIRSLHRSSPSLVESLMLDNDRVVYFRRIEPDRWPQASTGAVLVPGRSVAVDPDVIPLGSVVVVERADGERLVATAVDIGGAIVDRRIDLFLGSGPAAVVEAGGLVEPVRVRVLRPALRP